MRAGRRAGLMSQKFMDQLTIDLSLLQTLPLKIQALNKINIIKELKKCLKDEFFLLKYRNTIKQKIH